MRAKVREKVREKEERRNSGVRKVKVRGQKATGKSMRRRKADVRSHGVLSTI